ncbi:hypothetical protein GEMRC1_002978 [Eukaryota sp. GEM-RC1]
MPILKSDLIFESPLIPSSINQNTSSTPTMTSSHFQEPWSTVVQPGSPVNLSDIESPQTLVHFIHSGDEWSEYEALDPDEPYP